MSSSHYDNPASEDTGSFERMLRGIAVVTAVVLIVSGIILFFILFAAVLNNVKSPELVKEYVSVWQELFTTTDNITTEVARSEFLQIMNVVAVFLLIVVAGLLLRICISLINSGVKILNNVVEKKAKSKKNDFVLPERASDLNRAE